MNFGKGCKLFIYAMRMLLSLEYTLYSINYCNGVFRGALVMPDNFIQTEVVMTTVLVQS